MIGYILVAIISGCIGFMICALMVASSRGNIYSEPEHKSIK